ncbi:MAG: ABC transporter permease [Spirochaetaceae bacterium]|nr:ABC transporter permease [Spirochaetaceae bacterium]
MHKCYFIKSALILLIPWYIIAFSFSIPIVPFPHLIVKEVFLELLRGEVLIHLVVSLYRVLSGILLALIVAIPLGILMGLKNTTNKLLTPIIYLFQPVPKIALLPIFLVLFGIGDLSKILIVSMVIFFPAVLMIKDSVAEINYHYVELSKAYNLSKNQVLVDIIVPSILPGIFSTLRISVGISLSVLFFSENFATDYGIGYYIMNSWIMVNYLRMYTGIVFISLLGISLYKSIEIIENKMMPWKLVAPSNRS